MFSGSCRIAVWLAGGQSGLHDCSSVCSSVAAAENHGLSGDDRGIRRDLVAGETPGQPPREHRAAGLARRPRMLDRQWSFSFTSSGPGVVVLEEDGLLLLLLLRVKATGFVAAGGLCPDWPSSRVETPTAAVTTHVCRPLERS